MEQVMLPKGELFEALIKELESGTDSTTIEKKY
jgi:hypothetical protein